MLNLNGSLTKAGVKYCTLWSEDFDDDFFRSGLRRWLKTGKIKHDASPREAARRIQDARRKREDWAEDSPSSSQEEKAIMGVFDEGCMGMFNAIIPDELLHPTGVFKERLSQSALYAKMLRSATTKRARSTTGICARSCIVPPRRKRGNRSDRGADSSAVQDVHRRRAHRRRLRLRNHRHSISAGTQRLCPPATSSKAR